MQVIPLKTHRISYRDTIETVLDRYVPPLQNTDVVVITAKILSILEGCTVRANPHQKLDLIQAEADQVIGQVPGHPTLLTIKNGILIFSAGIDASNADGSYILYPKDLTSWSERIWTYLCQKNDLDQLGIIISDSHSSVMRRGITGIGLSFCGFLPLYSYKGKPDLFKRALEFTEINVLDALASAAVLVMGEGDEQTPMAHIHNPPKTVFVSRPPTLDEHNAPKICLEEDLYLSTLCAVYKKSSKNKALK